MNVLPNEMEAKEHLRKKHPQTYRQINEAKGEIERLAEAEDRVINRRILAKLAGVDIEEPAPIPTVNIPSVWETPRPEQSTSVTTTDVSDTTTVWFDAGAPVIEKVFIPPKHLHHYPKAAGAQCRVKGCTEIRKQPYKARK